MSRTGCWTGTARWLPLAMLGLLLASGLSVSHGQEPAANASEQAAAASDNDEAEPSADGELSDAGADAGALPPLDSDELSEDAADEETDAAQPAEEPAAGAAPAESSDAEETGSTLNTLLILGVLAVVFIVPAVVGGWLAKQFQMPDDGWRIAFVLGCMLASAAALYFGELRGGPDLVGGVTMIFEVLPPEENEQKIGADGVPLSAEQQRQVTMDELITALSQRVNPGGQREVTIRPYGANQVEIIIPATGDDGDLDAIKKAITEAGTLEFRIVAERGVIKDADIIEMAEELPPSIRNVYDGEDLVARWLPYNEDRLGGLDEASSRFVVRRGEDRFGKVESQMLVLIDPYNLTGEDITSPRASRDQSRAGEPQVEYSFTTLGSDKSGKLTSENVGRPMAIVLSDRIESAPNIQERIAGGGRISGGMTQEDVDFTVSILKAGSLPAQLNRTPLSEEVNSPTIGAETIAQGRFAILISLAAVLVFMVAYYNFCGIVAVVALALNLLFLLGIMALVRAEFSLAGLAGIVLTVGMSVDANVLIFERIREELSRGAALRMAIRNGFDRATRTIVDANLTTLITGIILFWIGTDQIKGFAVTLVLGIVMSMFTAIFCSRLIFDIAERRGVIRRLRMFRLVDATSIDFCGKRFIALACSLVLIAIGIAAFVGRGADNFNIDFTGGYSVTMVFEDKHATTQADVVKTLREETELGDRNLTVIELGTGGTQFKVNVRTESKKEASQGEVDGVALLQEEFQKVFQGKLKTYQVTVRPANESDTEQSSSSQASPFQLASMQQESGESDGDSEASDAATESRSMTTDTLTSATISFDEEVGRDTMIAWVERALADKNHRDVTIRVTNDGFRQGTAERFKDWDIGLGLEPAAAGEVFQALESRLESTPVFPLSSTIGSRVAGDMQKLAIAAILVSLIAIVIYIWLRFQHVVFGVAAVIALVHDVLVTMGMLALSAYIVSGLGPVADTLLLEPFQISLPIVAALLTIVGYSLNDTIVVFDRIREVRGKSPDLTTEMVNRSINQTLGRTLLTSLTTLIVVGILYFLGGAGIHAFAFALLVGVIAGTYSSVFVASPALLAMLGTEESASA